MFLKKFKSWSSDKRRNFLIYVLMMITFIIVPLNVILINQIIQVNKNFNSLSESSEQNASDYQKKVEDLESKVALLSDQMAVEIARNKEEEAKKNPVGIPVSGLATIETDPSQINEIELDPIEENNSTENTVEDSINPYTLEIAVLKDAKIIASGDGTVSLVDFDDVYGYIVKIDHDNGYTTVYRYSEMPKVNQGDQVLKGQMLYEVTKNKGIFAYHIMYENTYINPFELIELNG